jgi:hypothetical protein
VKFYKGPGCNGTVLLKYDGFADEVSTCGYKTENVRSITVVLVVSFFGGVGEGAG